jgi:hypothetical protein
VKVSVTFNEQGMRLDLAPENDVEQKMVGERARQLAEASEEGCRFGENEKPDVVQAVADGAPEFVYIFQDAGCC